jgi:hypothetical protein
MTERLLYPSDPLDPKGVDETFHAEYEAARAAGIATSIFSLEDFETGTFRPRPRFTPGEVVLYRGWMLPVPRYEQLLAAIESAGAKAFTSAEQYRQCHHLPGWYVKIRELTAETLILSRGTDFAAALADHDWPGYFVKDYVKSLNTAGGSLVDTPGEVERVVGLLESYRGEIEGGVCIRRREDFEPETEHRHFVFKGRPFSAHGAVPDIVSKCAAWITSPFFSVDTALRSDGTLRVIEIGDGQVSDRKEWTPEQLVEMLAYDGQSSSENRHTR